MEAHDCRISFDRWRKSPHEWRKKLFLNYGSKPFYAHILEAFSAFPVTYLSVEGEEFYRHLGLPMVTDLCRGQAPWGEFIPV